MYGYDRVGKVVPASPTHGHLSQVAATATAAARRPPRPRDHRGDAQPVPRPGHARARRARRRRAADQQPAGGRGERAADVAAARPAARRGLQRVAPPGRRSACSRSATSTRPVRASCPTSTRRWASCSPVRRRRRRSPSGARSPRRWASVHASTSRVVPAGLHPTRSATLVAGRDTIGAVGEVAPEVLDAFGITGGSQSSSSTCDPCSGASRSRRSGSRRAATRRATSTSRSSFPRTFRRRSSTRRSARAPGPARRPRPVRRLPRRRHRRRRAQPRVPAAAAGAGPQPDRRRRRRRPPAGHHGRPPSSGPSCAADGRVDAADPGGSGCVVPMTLSALIVGAIAVRRARRVRTRATVDAISGPAAGLPAVVGGGRGADRHGATGRLGGHRAGQTATARSPSPWRRSDDEVDFAAEFDRLPDAEARLAGRTFGEIQSELSPTAVDGSRGDADRAPDIVFALAMARAAVQATDPDASPRDQALAVLPFAVQDLVGFDEIADTFAAGDLAALGRRASTPASPARRGRAARSTEAGRGGGRSARSPTSSASGSPRASCATSS